MKKDPALGKLVHEHLVSLGLETPMHTYYHNMPKENKEEIIAQKFLEIMKVLNLDHTNDSMVDTPKRIARMYVNEIFSGLDYENFPKIMSFENAFANSGMVVEKGINVNSACSHHFVPTIGKATIGYIPGKKVLGLSKLNRVVNHFARRPQEQERMLEQIHATLCFLLETNDVAVYLDCVHMCVKIRGVENESASMHNVKLSGRFMDDSSTRSEFYSLAMKP